MRKWIARLAAIVLLIAALPVIGLADASAQQLDILGTWLRTSEDGSHQRGALIFTPTSYALMLVAGDAPRAEYQGDEMTDAQVLASYRSFTANMGRYRLEGNQLIREAYMAKDPNYMAGWPDNDQTWTVAMDGPNGLVTTNQNGVVTRWTRPTQNGAVVR